MWQNLQRLFSLSLAARARRSRHPADRRAAGLRPVDLGPADLLRRGRWTLLLAGWLALFSASPLLAQDSARPPAEAEALDSAALAMIGKTFRKSHFAKSDFTEARAQEMLRQYLDHYDPAHLFFLQSDVDGFMRQSPAVARQFPKGKAELAYAIYERFKERLQVRTDQAASILGKPVMLDLERMVLLSRDDAPYPESDTAAKRLLENRFMLELLQQSGEGQDSPAAGSEIQANLAKRYRTLRHRFLNYRRGDIITAYLNAYTASFDPHSSYLSQDELENFNIAMRLSLEGIGVTLRGEDGEVIITSVVPGGAADREGSLKIDDRIIGVAQGEKAIENVQGLRLGDVVKKIRGRRGTLVRLQILRRTQGVLRDRLIVRIVRDKIVLRSGEASGEIVERPRDPLLAAPSPDTSPGASSGADKLRLGIIKIPSFYVDFAGRRENPRDYKSVSRDVKKLIESFQKDAQNPIDGLVLDLRNNGGGGLNEAVSVAGLFLDRGPVVQVKNTSGRISLLRNPHRRALYRGPLLVLINRYSASASEIVTGALKDYRRALVIGERSTFGKGTVQNVFHLPQRLGAIKTTVAQFYRPGSASTQNRGVRPHIVLPALNNYLEIGESFLPNALPWNEVPPTDFQPWQMITEQSIPSLSVRSRMRVQKDVHFQQVQTEISRYLCEQYNPKQTRLSDLLPENDRCGARAETSPPKSATSAAKSSGKDDPFLDEALFILGDFIRDQHQQEQLRLAN